MTALTLYDAALWASVLIAAVGVIVLTVELTGVIRWLSDQPAREALHLSQVTAHDGGPFAGPGELDYVDDLPFVDTMCGGGDSDLRDAYPSPDHECDPGPYECQECCDLAVMQMGAPIATPDYEQRALARMGRQA